MFLAKEFVEFWKKKVRKQTRRQQIYHPSQLKESNPAACIMYVMASLIDDAGVVIYDHNLHHLLTMLESSFTIITCYD
jgi:hypothetical protein